MDVDICLTKEVLAQGLITSGCPHAKPQGSKAERSMSHGVALKLSQLTSHSKVEEMTSFNICPF